MEVIVEKSEKECGIHVTKIPKDMPIEEFLEKICKAFKLAFEEDTFIE